MAGAGEGGRVRRRERRGGRGSPWKGWHVSALATVVCNGAFTPKLENVSKLCLLSGLWAQKCLHHPCPSQTLGMTCFLQSSLCQDPAMSKFSLSLFFKFALAFFSAQIHRWKYKKTSNVAFFITRLHYSLRTLSVCLIHPHVSGKDSISLHTPHRASLCMLSSEASSAPPPEGWGLWGQ